MKRILHIGLVIAIIVLSGCSLVPKVQTESTKQQARVTTEALVSSAERVDLNQIVFADIYHLSPKDVVDGVYVHANAPMNQQNSDGQSVLEEQRNLEEGLVAFEDFKPIYEALLSLRCENSTESNVATYENAIEYEINFRVVAGDSIRNYAINFGKSYLLVSLIGETDLIYKHELSDDDYTILKGLLDRSQTNRVDLNQEVFADIYQLSADAKVDEIYVYSKILKKPRNLNDELVSFEEFKAVYGLLLTMDCKNSTQNEADFYDNPIEYTLDFAIDEGTRYRLFHIEFGKSYLLVNLKGVNTFAYKHELSEGDYESLKELLGKTPPALVH